MRGSASVLRLAVLAAGLCLASGAGAATVLVKAGDGTPDAGGCGTNTNPCDTIQAGVDNAVTGDVVKVAKGNYPEDVVIATPGITLTGPGTLLGSDSPICVGDPTRTYFAGGPETGACRDLPDQPSCEAAWHLGGNDLTASSCFWDGDECRGCGPNNESDGDCTNSCDPIPPAALHIDASDVKVEKLRIRSPRVGGVTVFPSAQNASLEKLRIEGTGSACIAGLGDGLGVERSTLRSCSSSCLRVQGEDARIERNRLVACDEAGISTQGGNTRIVRNSVRFAGLCIDFSGDQAFLERNQLSFCDEVGIAGIGSGASVLRNKAHAGSEGIFYECSSYSTSCADPTRTDFVGGPNTQACRDLPDQPACEAAWHLGRNGAASCFWDGADCRGCGPDNESGGDCTNTCVEGDRCEGLVSGNRVTDSLGDCLDFLAADSGLVVENNRATACGNEGIELEGVGIVATGNSVVECGSEPGDHGFSVNQESEDVLVEGNSVRGCAGDGFNVEGDTLNVMLVDNSAIDNGQDGFDVEAGAEGTTLEGANAKNNVASGIEVSSGAVDASVTGSKASGNLVDFCDAGTGTTESGNQFGTTSASCLPDPGEQDGGVI